MKVLFVDDEPLLLKALERALRVRKRAWTPSFVSTGEEALAALEREPFAVIVSDMGMPGMDGMTLLEHVRRRFPGVARVVLSGEARVQDRMRAVVASHQWFAKPCPNSILAAALDRIFWARSLVEDPELVASACGVASLPTSPRAHAALVAAVEAHDFERSVSVVESDVAITAKVLQLVNSSFFELGNRVTSARRACQILGNVRLRDVLLVPEVLRFDTAAVEPTTNGRRLSQIARELTDENHDEVALAGLLHGVGAMVAPERMLAPTMRARLGALVLATWGLPIEVATAVAFHRDPDAAPDPADPRLCAVALAHALNDESTPEHVVEMRSRACNLEVETSRALGCLVE